MDNRFYCKTLPNPFLKANGELVTSPSEWKEQADYIRKLAQEYMYGTWPGKAESVHGEVTRKTVSYDGSVIRIRETVKLTINDSFTVDAEVVRPCLPHKIPVIVNNSSRAWFGSPIENEATAAGYAIASYDREALAPDLQVAKMMNRLEEAQARTYPKFECGEIMAWAWGYSLVADWLETCDWAGDLICTGHSRNGKSALCAGVFDERFKVVAPIGSGCGGAGCARFTGTTDGSRQDPQRCETIGKMSSMFPNWMGKRYKEFGTSEEPYPIGDEVNAFPIDAHMLRAACAPRAVLSSEGEVDYWCNAFGNQLCWQASQKVFEFMGVPERNGFHVRPGGHAFNAIDWSVLVDFCDIVLGKTRSMPQPNLNKPYFDIDVSEYAPWAK